MSKVVKSKSSQLQANNAINGILANLLPGTPKISSINRKSKSKNNKVSKTQLIDSNLKKRIELQERDVLKIKRKEKKIKDQKKRENKLSKNRIQQQVKKELLNKHKKNGNLTNSEKKQLNEIVRKNESSLRSWEMDDEDDKDKFDELQKFVLDNVTNHKSSNRSKKRRSKKKAFKEEAGNKDVEDIDYRYRGLTPGLAPVGLSDEEDSSEEENEDDDDGMDGFYDDY